MGCERPGGPIIDTQISRFLPNWSGALPPPATRGELKTQLAPGFQRRSFSEEQVEQALDFFEQYEARYYESTEGERRGMNFHRVCGGGAMVQGETGVFCANCGRLPDLFPPAFMR